MSRLYTHWQSKLIKRNVTKTISRLYTLTIKTNHTKTISRLCTHWQSKPIKTNVTKTISRLCTY